MSMNSSEVKPLVLHLPEGTSLKDFPAPTGFTLRFLRPVSKSITFWDTFEWGVWYAGFLLCREEKTLSLYEKASGWIGALKSSTELQETPHFASTISDLKFRKELHSLAGLRSFQPVAEMIVESRQGVLMNQDEKAVCRFEIVTLFSRKPKKPPLHHFCHFLPMRGYETEGIAMLECLKILGAQESQEGALEKYFALHPPGPRPYSLRPRFDLTESTPAGAAISKIVLPMLDLAEENKPGLLADQDTEFLHDYRICLRKIRSVISLLKGVYSESDTLRLKKTLALLASRTNRLRDLDVTMLSREDYQQMLPLHLRKGIERMFQDYARERVAEFRKVTTSLRSPASRHLHTQIRAFFEHPKSRVATEKSFLPVAPMVAGRIYKRYRKMQALRDLVSKDGSDEGLHQLRIHGKKLRYLLEFFSELFPASQTIEKRLRRLQNRLGIFNDLSVQQAALLNYWHGAHSHLRDRDEALCLSVGGLMTSLYCKQQKQRKRLSEALDDFFSKNTTEEMKQLFRIPKETQPS